MNIDLKTRNFIKIFVSKRVLRIAETKTETQIILNFLTNTIIKGNVAASLYQVSIVTFLCILILNF